MSKTGTVKTGQAKTGGQRQFKQSAKTGRAKTGEQPTGGGNFEVVQLPSRTLELSRDGPTATGDGTATADVATRSLELSRTAITLAQITTLPSRNLELSRDTPTVEGDGTATVDVPLRELELSRFVPDAGSVEWVINNSTVGEITEEIAESDRLTLTTRVATDVLDAALRPLKSDEGKVETLTTDDGGFVAVDRANGNNTFEIRPPLYRRPLRQIDDYHVDRYEESLVSQDISEWDVTLELIPEANRSNTQSISESPAADEWGFDTRYGTIATPRIDAEFAGTGEGGVERYELTGRLTFAQTLAFEAALNRQRGTRIKEIPDAPNVVRDETDDDANTVTIDAPDSQDTVSDGDYVVLEWESEWLNNAYQSVEFVIGR